MLLCRELARFDLVDIAFYGLLDDRREATWVYFQHARSPGPAQKAVLGLLTEVLTERVPEEFFARLDEWRKRKAKV